jgi:polysaccharide pyruvyl transferase WcaK-like protein
MYVVFMFLFSSKTSTSADIKSSDVVLINGGNLIRCNSFLDFIRLIAFFYPLLWAKIYGKKTVILPQSTVSINWLGRILVGFVFSKVDQVWVRENESLAKFKKMFPQVRFKYSPDMAFHMKEFTAPSVKPELGGALNVAVTLREYGLGDVALLPEEKRRAIVDGVVESMRALSKCYQLKITVVVQCDKDDEVSRRLVDKLDFVSSVSIFDSRCSYRLQDVYARNHLLIGMRLHSIILALAKSVLCIGFFDQEWGLKNPGILGDFSQSYSYIESGHFSLIENVQSLVENFDYSRSALQKKITQDNNSFSSQFD